MILAQAEARGGSSALLGVDRTPLRYNRLVAEIGEVAGRLAALGVGRGDRVAMVLPNGPEMALAFLAVTAVATAAPLNPAYSRAEFEFYLADLGARTLIVNGNGNGNGDGTEGCPAAVAAARALGVGILILESAGPGSEAGVFRLRGDTGAVPPDGPGPGVVWAGPEDAALVLHTSGTTSRPKRVPLTQANLADSAAGIARSLELGHGDRCLNVMPLFHVHGLMAALLASLVSGGSVVCTPGFATEAFAGWLPEFQPTWFTAVPTMHQALVARCAAGGLMAAPGLRFIRSCSAALPPRLMAGLEEAFGVPVVEAYGMTEASHQMASNPLPPRARKPGSVGIAAGSEVAVMDAAGNLLERGAVGELVIRGPNVTRGYEGNPEANAGAFTDGWFRTGDQGSIDAEGYVFLSGRLKEIINRGGEKISPREIDEVLLEHPGVAQAVAFAMPHPVLGEDVAAAVVPREGGTVTERELREFALTRLAYFKVPARVLMVREIPKGPTGKIQRMSLARTLGVTGPAAPPPRPAFEAPGSTVEVALAGFWEEILRIRPVGAGDGFLSLGGDSLGLARIGARIREVFLVQVGLGDLLGAATLRDMAGVVEGAVARLAGAGAGGDAGVGAGAGAGAGAGTGGDLAALLAEAEAMDADPGIGGSQPGQRSGPGN